MRDFAGTPGTLTGLALRLSQCVFAAGSITAMTTTTSFFDFTAFCYLIASMGLQVIWSFGLALLDAYALVKKKALHNTVMLSLFVVGDWVTAILSLAAASASAGITVLYFHDLGNCDFVGECQKYQMLDCCVYTQIICIFSCTKNHLSHRDLIFLPCQYKRKQEYLIDFQNFDFSLSREIGSSTQNDL